MDKGDERRPLRREVGRLRTFKSSPGRGGGAQRRRGRCLPRRWQGRSALAINGATSPDPSDPKRGHLPVPGRIRRSIPPRDGEVARSDGGVGACHAAGRGGPRSPSAARQVRPLRPQAGPPPRSGEDQAIKSSPGRGGGAQRRRGRCLPRCWQGQAALAISGATGPTPPTPSGATSPFRGGVTPPRPAHTRYAARAPRVRCNLPRSQRSP